MNARVLVAACALGGALTVLGQDTNRLRWQFDTGKYVFSSPAIGSDGTIYIGSGNGRFYAFAPNGKTNWTFQTGAEIQSSPAIGKDDTIYFGSVDARVYALAPNGSKKWDFQTAGPILCSPTLGADGTIYIGSRDGYFYALEPDGRLKWRFATGAYYTDMPAVVGAEGTILVSAAGTIHALKHDGEQRLGASDLGVAMAIGRGGTIYAALAENGPNRTLLFALNHRGETQWDFACGQITAVANPSFPAIARDGTIYLSTPDSFLYAIHPDGSQKWKVPATRSQSAALLSNNGKVYVNSSWDFRLLCYDLNGVLNWQHEFGTTPGAASGLISSFPVLNAGVIYLGSGNGQVYAISTTGELEEGGWPAFGRNSQHTGRDVQRGIEALPSAVSSPQQLRLQVESGRPYTIQGSSNLREWEDCTNFISTSTLVLLPRIGSHVYYRLATP